ncbi:hypothetical protein ATL39_2997 [Sinobaca qinghaiensis]|uniref:ABC-2 family transporter n=1 Tax=Sinobaca qinghaiensis TaxID=342944 RepID=A0A419UWR5_9BACL|nr:hypothetical protein [Sinobaca qinghaiensis]RKD69577.1 hypothetical protein ATL39_2997 [Sinobaca qinghaiensis]
MKNLLSLEWHKVKWPVLITMIMCTVLSIYLCSSFYKRFALEEQLEAWEVGMPIFNFMFALIAVVPTGWVLYYERKNNFINYIIPRVNIKKYLFVKGFIMSGSAFAIMFILSFAGVLTVLFINSPIDVVYSRYDPATGETFASVENNHIFGSVFVNQPLVYGFLMSIWKGVLTALMAAMGFVFSMYTNNLFLILGGPFLYTNIENFTLAVLQLEAYRLVTAFEPTTITVSAVNIFSFITGPLLVLLLIGVFIFYMRFIKKRSVYSI